MESWRRTTPLKSGVLWGVNYEVWRWGVLCYACPNNLYLWKRKYVGNGTDPVKVRECVKDFRKIIKGDTL